VLCSLLQIAAVDLEVVHPFGDAWVPVASLVEPVVEPVESCEGGQVVRLVSPVVQYQEADKPHAPVGAEACVASELLAPAGELFVHQETGVVGRCCHCAGAGDRPITTQQLGRIHRVRDAYQTLFEEEVNLAWIRVTEWDKVGLPLRWYSEEEIAARYVQEGLDTDERKEKAVVAEGGNYLHFLGYDAPYTDIWGQEDFIIDLLEVAKAFGTTPETTVQFGDISYYNRKRPDPLGHSDHSPGTCVDIRLFRDDASRYEAWWNQPDDRPGDWSGYSAALTHAFTALLRSRDPTKLFFNDPDDPSADFWRGHDDHIHYCQDRRRP